MQSGELIVIGKDQVVIQLHGMPSGVKCRFRHEHHIVPCNPNHADTLEYEVRANPHHCGHVLIIKWHVSGVREIIWHAHY